MKRRQLTITLMLCTIGAIAVFQGFWIQKNFADARTLFTIRTNGLFRETVFHLQAGRLYLDTSVEIRHPGGSGLISVKKMIHHSFAGQPPGDQRIAGHTLIGDTDLPGATRTSQAIFITSDHIGGKPVDSMVDRFLIRTGGPKLVGMLAGLDSTAKPIAVEEIIPVYKTSLDKEGIHLPFRITAAPYQGDLEKAFQADTIGNRVTLGFKRPVVYEVHFDHTFWYMAARILPQLLFSLLLVGFTILSFLLLYRNWQQQHRLTLLKNDLISNITHELKTPIATVSVAVEALRKFNALDDPDRTREYLDISAEELQRLSMLVDNVLKLSLFERQKIELKTETFDMQELIREVMASMRLQFEKYGARVAFHATGGESPAGFRITADRLHMTSVLFNLLDNALKYGKTDPSIRVELSASPGSIGLAVIDNGIGIPAAYKDRIFEKFFRVPTGDRHDVKGYGMGLSYVYYILQRHGGTIQADSEMGAGSRFTIHLPLNHG